MEADPKSASFTCPGSVRRIFPALMSLQEREGRIRELRSRFLLCRRPEHAISKIKSFLNTQAYFSQRSLRVVREPAFLGGHWKDFQEELSSEGGVEQGKEVAMPVKESSELATLTKHVLQCSIPPTANIPRACGESWRHSELPAAFPFPKLSDMPAWPPWWGLLSWTHTCSVLPETLSLCL